jgi:hypothetical protein
MRKSTAQSSKHRGRYARVTAASFLLFARRRKRHPNTVRNFGAGRLQDERKPSLW